MTQIFDPAAAAYDEDFTWSATGRKLRNIVWDYLGGIIPLGLNLKILELNCGTGEDAVYFGKQGHTVVGIDISSAMIEQAAKKAEQEGLGDQVSFIRMDMRNIRQELDHSGFDLIFSNFGGLNCLNDLEISELSGSLTGFLKPGGRMVAVVMGKYCLWESFYFLVKMKFNNVFRRTRREGLQVDVGGQKVQTWYYLPHEIKTFFRSDFRRVGLYPLGLFLPPSYLDPFFKNRSGWLNSLNKMESMTFRISALSYLSDHFIMDLETL